MFCYLLKMKMMILMKYGYGYDSNDNDVIEIFFNYFNYPVFLNSKGIISLPLTDKKIKLNVYDYITDSDIKKLQNK